MVTEEAAPDDEATGLLATEGDDDPERQTVADPVASAVVSGRANDRSAAGTPPRRAPSPTSSPSISPSTSGSMAQSARSAGSLTRGGATTIGSPLLALERDEILRTRWFCLVALAMVIIGGASVLFVPGDQTAATMLIIAVLMSVGGIAFLYRRTADPIAYRRPSTMIGFFLPTLAVAAAIPYFGAFSPAPVLVVLAVYFTGLGSSVRLAAAVWSVCAVSQAATAGLVILGVTRDTGLVSGAALSGRVQWMIQLLVQMVMAGTFITARMSRRSALLAVGELERAIRIATQREALLLEARAELDRALRSGRGRFSDQVIAGYELGDVIGRGAMGEVYGAADPRTGEPVAIKLLSQTSLGNPQHVQRFFRELKTAAGISSPNVVRVIEVGEHPVPFLVMERLEGKSLAEILRGRRTLGVEKVLDLVRQVGEGLAAAASAGVIHRDIKPQNLFLHHGSWKILDFGVARLAEHGDTLTSGQVVGTPSYMSPEQARGAPVDHRTDLYALTAVAYRGLTGQPPFAAREVAETLYRVVHTAPRRPSELVTLAPDLELVLAIGLAKQVDERFASAAELVDAFAHAAAGDLARSLRDRGRALAANEAWSSIR